MEVAFVQEHFLEVIREVYELNEQNEQTGVGSLVRFAVLTCNGPWALEKLKHLANRAEPQDKPLYEGLSGESAGPGFRTLIFPTPPGIVIRDGKKGKGIYTHDRPNKRLTDIETRVNSFFGIEVFTIPIRGKSLASTAYGGSMVPLNPKLL